MIGLDSFLMIVLFDVLMALMLKSIRGMILSQAYVPFESITFGQNITYLLVETPRA